MTSLSKKVKLFVSVHICKTLSIYDLFIHIYVFGYYMKKLNSHILNSNACHSINIIV